MRMKTGGSGRAGPGGFYLRSSSLLLLCVLLCSSVLLLASVSLFSRVAVPPNFQDLLTDRVYALSKPLPLKQSLSAVNEAASAITESTHQRGLSRADRGGRRAGQVDQVQDVVTFREDVLLLVRVTEDGDRRMQGFRGGEGNESFVCIFQFPGERHGQVVKDVFHTPVTSVTRKEESGNVFLVRCAHPEDQHLVERTLLSYLEKDGASAGVESDVDVEVGRLTASGTVTLAVQGEEKEMVFPTRGSYTPLHLANATWEEPLVYEVTAQEESLVLLVKNIKNRGSNKHFDVQDLSCVFMGLGGLRADGKLGEDEQLMSTRALLGAQEVVHCEWPDVEARRSLVGAKVSLSGARLGGVSRSVAYFTKDMALMQQGSSAGKEDMEEEVEGRRKSSSKGPGVCACTMLWNKAKFLREWVTYHAHLGVERFFVYDNNSDDGLEEVVGSLSREGKCGSRLLSPHRVSMLAWPWLKTQQAAFSHCAVAARKEGCEWVAFTDVDEYIFPTTYMIPAQSVSAEAGVSTRRYSRVKNVKQPKSKRSKKVKPGSAEVLQLPRQDDEGAWEGVHKRNLQQQQLRGADLEELDVEEEEEVLEEEKEKEQEQGAECINVGRKEAPILRRLIEDVTQKQSRLYVPVNSSEVEALAIGEIRFDCNNFGPSGLKSHPEDGVTVSYDCRMVAPERHKSLVRTDAFGVSLLNLLHHFELRPGFTSVSMRRKYGVVNHYKFQVWEDFKLKFVRRAGTYTTDWTSKENVKSLDRTPGLSTEPVMPEDWHQRFCQLRDSTLKGYVRSTFATTSGKLLWQL